VSGYSHTISFKVLIESEVIDFTFRVPRGTLLIQILDELETTLKVQPKVVAVINDYGEVVVLENHYSAVDYLVQKYGNEFYAGEASYITFNYGNYIVDLEVPESIPFAATYRTACKSFELKTREVGIERQDGQVMDYEVFTLPTAFVLNSWGNYYKIVSKESGDVFVEPIKEPTAKVAESESFATGEMVYPPKLDGSDIIEVAKELIDVSPVEETEVDQMTQNYLQRLEEGEKPLEPTETTPQEKIAASSPDDFITEAVKPTEQHELKYPWEKGSTPRPPQATEEFIAEEPPKETIEELFDDLSIDDELEESLLEDTESAYESIPPLEELTEGALKEQEEVVDKTTIAEVFRGIMVEEEREKELREGPTDVFEEEVIKEAPVSDVPIESSSKEEILTFADEEEPFERAPSTPTETMEEEELLSSYDLPEITSTEASSPAEELSDEISEEEEPIKEYAYDIPYIQEEEEEQELPTEATPPVSETSLTTTSAIEAEPMLSSQTLEQESLEVEEELLVASEPLSKEQAVPPEPLPPPPSPVEEVSLEERLQKKQAELKVLQATLLEQEQVVTSPLQTTISIEYYERMYPQKIYPLLITFPKKNGGNFTQNKELRIEPRLPGCYVTPTEELLEFDEMHKKSIEFNITPLIKRGRIPGKVGLWLKKRTIMSVNINSRVVNPFWVHFFGVLAALTGLFTTFALAFNLNDLMATSIGRANFANLFLGLEVGFLLLLLFLTFGLLFGQRPQKKTTRRTFSLQLEE